MRFNSSCFRSSIYSANAAKNASSTSLIFVRHHLQAHYIFPTCISWNPPSPIISRPIRPLFVPITSPKTTTTTFPISFCTNKNNTASANTQNREPKDSKFHLFFRNQIGIGMLIMMTVFMDKYIAGTFFASVFGFLILCILRRRINKQYKQKLHADRPGLDIQSNRMAVDELRTCRNSDTDVIIVGAGVAGAALSYTLGKVEGLPCPSSSPPPTKPKKKKNFIC